MTHPYRRTVQHPLWAIGLAVMCTVLAELRTAFAAEPDQVVPEVLDKKQRGAAAGMINRDIRRRSAEVNARNRAEWSRIENRAQWEAYRDERIGRLRRSLAEFPAAPAKLDVRVTGV